MENIRYFTSFTGSSAAAVVTPDSGFFLTDSRYMTQAYNEVCVRGIKIKGYKKQIEQVACLLNQSKVKRVGFEDKGITYEYYQKLKSKLTGKRLIPLSDEVNRLRIKKDEAEIETIRDAVRIGKRCFETAKRCIRAGVIENDIAVAMEFEMRKEGAEKAAFDIIVASGKRASLPHGKASLKAIKRGEMVVVDSGVMYKGYNSDETCTFFVGAVTKKQRDIYNIVKEAHDAAIECVMPGVKTSDIDKTARGIIKKAGYGKYFGHGTGHGVGLQVHEMPSISCTDNTVLEEGMVFTIEPGIYIPGWGGVRVEDMLVVTADGCEVLTNVSKDITVL
ncbi:MAG TPA: integrase [Deltaproteobacteria bacterium]|nr:integrase [Deltaproteobacteria bacterium]